MLAKGLSQESNWWMKEAVTELTWENIECAVPGLARESYRIAAIHPNKWQEGELSRHAGLHVFELDAETGITCLVLYMSMR